MQNFIGLLTALLGSAGFALIFNVRRQLLPLAALGGAVCWGTYLLAGCATESVFLQSFAASAIGSTPRTGRSLPSKLSSPRNAQRFFGSFTCSEAARIDRRIGRS